MTFTQGKDKYENEDLIRYGLPEDLWFHVDNLSSAHVYLRLRKNQRLEDVCMPMKLLQLSTYQIHVTLGITGHNYGVRSTG